MAIYSLVCTRIAIRFPGACRSTLDRRAAARTGPVMMRNVVDQYIKDALSTLLTSVRRVEREKEVSREAQRIDFYVAPAPEPGLPPCPLGLLGRLVARPCGLEHFSATPGAAKVIACVSKHLILCHEVSPHRLASRPMSWVLSSGAPTSAMRALRCEPARGWMKGIYSAPPGLRVGIVVLRELRETRDTLLLRLFARGATLKRAMAELTALPPEAPEVQIMVPIMLRWRQAVPASPSKQTSEEKEFLMTAQEAIKMWEQQRQRGIEEGREEGLAPARHALLVLYEVRFGRVPKAVRARVEATTDPDTLMGWTDLVARGARADVDRALRGA